MSLTGPVFLGLVAASTVAAFVAVVALWPRFGGRDVRRVAARAGLLLGVNLLVLLTAATQLNAQFLFFADWPDLVAALGGSPATTSVDRGGVAVRAAGEQVPGAANAPPGVTPPRIPAFPIGPDGVIRATVTGPLSGVTGTVVVRLPPGYTDPARAAIRYPVLETFHGYPGSPEQWLRTMDLGGAMADATGAGAMRAAIIVSPQLEVPAGVDTECVNGGPGRPQLETWLARDVPNWVVQHFWADELRSSWATIGLSAGGWCAAMVAMLDPAQFSAAVVMGGYFEPEFSPGYEPYPPGGELDQRYDLVALARRAPPPVALWLETSHADPLSYSSSAALLKVARPPFSVAATVLEHAGHRIGVWQGLLPEALAWLGRNVPGFSPGE